MCLCIKKLMNLKTSILIEIKVSFHSTTFPDLRSFPPNCEPLHLHCSASYITNPQKQYYAAIYELFDKTLVTHHTAFVIISNLTVVPNKMHEQSKKSWFTLISYFSCSSSDSFAQYCLYLLFMKWKYSSNAVRKCNRNRTKNFYK